MPLFKRSPTPPTPVPETASSRKRGTIFSSSNRAAEDTATTAPDVNETNMGSRRHRRGLFRLRSTGSSSDVDSTRRFGPNRRGSVGPGTSSGHTARTGSLIGRSSRSKDGSLDAARRMVALAEKAEKDADAALATARKAVVEARRHVQTLEEEANEQARLAHEKVLGIRSLKNDASGLGRFLEK